MQAATDLERPARVDLSSRSAHLHREVFHDVLPGITPRLVPWSKRFFWRVVLAMVSNPVGRRLLLALRRR